MHALASLGLSLEKPCVTVLLAGKMVNSFGLSYLYEGLSNVYNHSTLSEEFCHISKVKNSPLRVGTLDPTTVTAVWLLVITLWLSKLSSSASKLYNSCLYAYEYQKRKFKFLAVSCKK